MDKTLVIMAAGMGSRYGGLKQIDPVGPSGEIIIDYSAYDAMNAGFNKIVFIIKEENLEVFKNTIGDKVSTKVKVEYVFQKTDNIPERFSVPSDRVKPWGTAHAIMCCKDVVKEPFAVINADDFYGRKSFQKISQWMDKLDSGKKPYDFCMAGYILKNTLTENGYVSRGICNIDSDSKLISVTERTKIMRVDGTVKFCEDDTWQDLDENSIASMNCWGFSPVFIEEAYKGFSEFYNENLHNLSKAEYYLPTVVTSMIKSRKCEVKVLPTDEKWIGVTYKEDKPYVKDAIKSMVNTGIYPQKLW